MTSPKHISLAEYLKTDPQEIELWVEDGQLHLVGATLGYLTATSPSRSREHKVADLQATLEPLLEQTGVKWSTWWKKVQPRVSDAESKYFGRGEQGRSTYRLKPGVSPEQVPVEPLATRPKTKKSAGSSSRKTASAKSQAADLKQLRDSHAAFLKQVQESHAATLKQLQESHNALKQQQYSQSAALKQLQESYAADLKRQKESYATDLERWKREEDRLYNRINTLIADKAALREESRLEIRQEMLLRVGDAIQRGHQTGNTPESRLNELMELLPYALRDGGAQPLGTVGDTVPYDPRLHHSTEKIPISSLVRLSAPGVIVIGGTFGDKVILKANVTRESEAT